MDFPRNFLSNFTNPPIFRKNHPLNILPNSGVFCYNKE